MSRGRQSSSSTLPIFGRLVPGVDCVAFVAYHSHCLTIVEPHPACQGRWLEWDVSARHTGHVQETGRALKRLLPASAAGAD